MCRRQTGLEFSSFLEVLWPDIVEIEDMLFVGNELVEELLLDRVETLRAERGDKS